MPSLAAVEAVPETCPKCASLEVGRITSAAEVDVILHGAGIPGGRRIEAWTLLASVFRPRAREWDQRLLCRRCGNVFDETGPAT